MKRMWLGICGVLLFGSFGMASGAFAAPVDAPKGTHIAAETCSKCVSTCAHMHDMMMRDCANTRKYRTKMQQSLCRSFAMEEYGRCLKECEHNKK